MKAVFALVLVTAISLAMHAQRTDAYFGVKAGLNVASLNVEDGKDLNSIVSGHAGGLVHIHISPHFAIQPELFLSGQGGEDDGDKLKLIYLNLPVLFQYMAGNGFRLHTGPQLGVLLSAKEKIGNAEYEVNSSFDNIDFGWDFGASYQFPGSGFGLDARYTVGLTDITESSSSDVQNRVFAFGVFYQFMNNRIGRK
jgi:outer membrane protein with beta-barrel domain